MVILRLLAVGAIAALVAVVAGCGGESRRAENCVILRLHGSTTIGSAAAPALAREYLRWLGADTVSVTAGADPQEVYVVGGFGGRSDTVAIRSNGSRAGLRDLAEGSCEIAMSSMTADSADCQRLSHLGDMRSVECRHEIARDGLVVVVNPLNPLDYMSMRDVREVFGGKIRHWSVLTGLFSDSIHVYCPDGFSGTYWTFAGQVMGATPLSSSSVMAGSRVVASSVSRDPRGVGVVSMALIDGNRAVSISEDGVAAVAPGTFSVATGDYPLIRPLVLYHAHKSDNGHIEAFIELTSTPPGRAAIEACGLVSDTVRVGEYQPAADAPREYREMASGALRLSTTFRFESDGRRLDERSREQLGQLVRFLQREGLTRCEVRLAGFADARGSDDESRAVSSRLAQSAATTLRAALNINTSVIALGARMPVASNATTEGRARNRRVEVWLACGRQAVRE